MHIASCLRRGRLRVLLALPLVASVFQFGVAPMRAEAQTQPDWLVTINNLRSAAGLPAVVEDSALSTGATHHSRYVVMNQTLVHAEDPSKPGYTVDGDAAGQSGDVGAAGQLPSGQAMVYGYMASVFHWEGILDPGLQTVGYGTATFGELFPGQAFSGSFPVANTLVLNRAFAQAAKPIMWPPNGGTLPYTSYGGGEIPNPLTTCAGYSTPVGAPLSVQLPAAPQVSSVSVTQAGVGVIPSCSFTGATVKFSANDQSWASIGTSILTHANAVMIIPQQPLANGTYCVSVTNSGTPINWSFTVGGSPTTPPAPCGAGSVATATPAPAGPTATPTSGASSSGKLIGGQGLNVNQQIVSPNGKTRLLVQSDGNVCLYRLDTGAALWCTNTPGKPVAHLLMQTDGNLVLYNSDNTAVYWSSGTFGHPGATLTLRDDGNLVILDANGVQLWASNTAWNTSAPAATPTAAPTVRPTATPAASGGARMVANQDLKVNAPLVSSTGKTRLLLQTDGNLCEYRVDNGAFVWCSGTFGKAMTHVLMQTDGNFVGYNSTNSVAFWSTGTSGHPGASLVLRDDGNLQVVDQNGAQLYSNGISVN
jgi:hypothetical protein